MARKVRIVASLDSCTDSSARIARAHGVEVIITAARNVGVARAAGAEALLSAGARWLAFTDADSEVPNAWLSLQLARESDAVCGIVSIKNWDSLRPW